MELLIFLTNFLVKTNNPIIFAQVSADYVVKTREDLIGARKECIGELGIPTRYELYEKKSTDFNYFCTIFSVWSPNIRSEFSLPKAQLLATSNVFSRNWACLTRSTDSTLDITWLSWEKVIRLRKEESKVASTTRVPILASGLLKLLFASIRMDICPKDIKIWHFSNFLALSNFILSTIFHNKSMIESRSTVSINHICIFFAFVVSRLVIIKKLPRSRVQENHDQQLRRWFGF